jgi:hypothetical protein
MVVQVNAQHNQRTFHFADQTVQNNVWEMFSEERIPKYKQASIRTPRPQEHHNLTKDRTDYLWYTTSFRLEADDLPFRRDIKPVLEVASHGHATVAFVNNVFVGTTRPLLSDISYARASFFCFLSLFFFLHPHIWQIGNGMDDTQGVVTAPR